MFFRNPLKKYSDAYLYEVSRVLAGELADAIDTGNEREVRLLKKLLGKIGKEQHRRQEILNVYAERYAR